MRFPQGRCLEKNHTAINFDQFERHFTHEQHDASAKRFLLKWKILDWKGREFHRLRDIIILAMCGVKCGAEGWVEIEEFGNAKEAWFTEMLKLPHGISSHDTDAASLCAHRSQTV